MSASLDLSHLTDEQLEILEANLAKRSQYVRFCEDSALFGKEIPQKPHRVICQKLQEIADGKLKRLMIFAPPGIGKSEYVSKRFAAWLPGYIPGIKLICASHTAGLASKHGRISRNIIANPDYRTIWPEVRLAPDLQARNDWATTEGSELFAVGFDGAVAGRRADGILIDDPFTGRLDADSETIRENVWTTYNSDLKKRLRKDGWIVIMHTRWHEDDLAGRILPANWDGRSGMFKSRDGREEWFVANLQMVNEFGDDLLGRPIGGLLWPEWFDEKRVEQDRLDGERDWNSQFQGHPSDLEGNILKSKHWRKWPGEKPPIVDYVVQVYDTAFEEGEENDYSARTTWGVWDIYNEQNSGIMADAIRIGTLTPWTTRGEIHRYHAILLERINVKLEFPELVRNAKDSYKHFKPDRVLIEKKASGHSLIHEMHRAGLPVKAVKADKSKLSRAYAAQVPFENGAVWYMDRGWAQEVITNCAQFPNGKHDDLFDTVVHAITWLRRTYHLVLKGETDEDDDRAVQEERVN